MRIYIVDAFTDQLFKGNPAGICIMDTWPADELMQQIAFENNQAETAFCVKEGELYHIRWFTPSTEVILCGHATLATAHVLFNEMGLEGNKINFTSLSGILTVTRDKDYLTLDFPVDTVHGVDISEELLACFSIPPIAAFKGKTDYMVVFHSQADIENIHVDMNAIAKLEARGIIITARGIDVDFVSRFFAPQSGINEDPVTGSAHTTLMPYWASVLNKQQCTAKQLSPRGGYLVCEMAGDRVKISGNAVTYLVGDLKN